METMPLEAEDDSKPHADDDSYRRQSILIADGENVLFPGEPGFYDSLSRTFESAESLALERTFQLKQRLREATTFDFWQILMEGLTMIMGAQYAFVAKRVLYDDENSAVEMPPLGEPGSCLMGLAFYFNDHKGQSGLFRDYKYKVYGCPCQWMRHDRVLVIPGGLTTLTPNNPNAPAFPIPPEGYLAVPLFHRGKCFAHFGVMFSAEALQERRLGWGMLEMFLHALEDQVCGRILEGLGLGETGQTPGDEVIPRQKASMISPLGKQSLRPYARRLSHELRTPMQGVVGMLDVMYASVIEASDTSRWEWPDLKQLKGIIEGLRAGIEVAQDSSKRAVDAADNMVHAYDFDMQVPSTPFQGPDTLSRAQVESQDTGTYAFEIAAGPDAGVDTPRTLKRRRESEDSSEKGMPRKMAHVGPEPVEAAGDMPPARNQSRSISPGLTFFSTKSAYASERSPVDVSTPQRTSDALALPVSGSLGSHASTNQISVGTPLSFDSAGKVLLSSRPVRLRELLHQVVHESLRSGGRPDFTRSVETDKGERITVETRASDGIGAEEQSVVEIETLVEESVPEIMIADAAALTKLLSSVFHNSVKFTLRGRISITVATTELRQILFTIADTGEGIPEEFIPELFKAFSREDVSLTRHRDGLGLGLMVAKGIARKMGGDLWCERTSTTGESQGTEFRIRLPITPADATSASTPGTPIPTPTPGSLLLDTSASTPPVSSQRRNSPTHSEKTLSSGSSVSITRKKRPRKIFPFDAELGKKLPLRILVVEDNRINRNLLCSMLKRLGYDNVEEARDGIEAVETFSSDLQMTAGRGFDLVLMDLWMPRMDGYDAAERILRIARDKGGGGEEGSVTVLAVSADATEEARTKAAEKGIRGFVGKPFGMVELGKALWEFCG